MRQIISKHNILITVLYTLVSIWLFSQYGVKNVNDSHRYLTYAHNLQSGFYLDAHNMWYFGYVFFIFLANQISENEWFLIFCQYFISLWAVLALYHASLLLHQKRTTALLTALLYIFFIDILSWNSYILCESLYSSLMCFSLYAFVWIYRTQKIFFWQYLLTFGIVFWTIFTKPSALALTGTILAIGIYYVFKLLNNSVLKYISTLFLILGFLLLTNKMLATFLIIKVYALGEIVFATARMPYQPVFDWVMLKVPENLYIPDKNHTPIFRLLSFIFHNPIYFMQLFLSKLFYFIAHIRPYWSWKHNILSLFVLIPVYFYTIRIFITKKLTSQIRFFVLVFIGIHVLTVGMTVVDWDGRFLIPILPVLFLFVSAEIQNDIQRVF